MIELASVESPVFSMPTFLDGKFDGRLSRLLNKVKKEKHRSVLHLAQL